MDPPVRRWPAGGKRRLTSNYGPSGWGTVLDARTAPWKGPDPDPERTLDDVDAWMNGGFKSEAGAVPSIDHGSRGPRYGWQPLPP